LLLTAEDSSTTAGIPRPSKPPLYPHKILTWLTCCVKMAQQISYTQEMKDLMEQEEVASTSSLKILHPFSD